ncbi:MAG TPA: hypothetical protein VFA21_17000 [Pyrinomonadaceae bacterium]|nr:hypothetical protein [Pyrinomonadaceae bacterium]
MCTLHRPADSRQRFAPADGRPASVGHGPARAGLVTRAPDRLRTARKQPAGACHARDHLLPLTLGLIILAVAALPARAQDASAAKPVEAGADDKAEERAYALLEDVIAKAQALKLPENRIRFQTTAACLLWPRDEGRARTIIAENMNALASLIAGADTTDPRFAERSQAYTILRYELVRMIAARDAKLALNFLRGTRQERPAARRPPAVSAPDPELALELTLAAQIAPGDAKEAARIAEESLGSGVAAELLNVLGRLSTADGEAATALATDIIKKLQAEDLTSEGDATVVAVGLLSMTRAARGSAEAAPDRADADARAVITVDEQTRGDLIGMIAAAAASVPAGRMANAHLLFNSLPAVMPELERYAPGQWAAVRAKSDEFGRSLDPSARAWQKYEGLVQQGSADALLEAAAKAPAEVGDELYADAAFKILDDGDPERARQIINSISDPQRRARKSKLLEQQLLERSLLRGKLEDAAQRIPPDATPEERFSTLLYLSNLAAQRKETALARRFISEAAGLVAGRVRSGSQFTARLQLARALSATEPKQAFAVLDELADQLNDLLAAAEVVDGFGPDCFSEGELKPFAGNLWGGLVAQFGEELAALAPKDAERAASIARKLQRDEVNVSVSLRVAGRVLADAAAKRRGHAPTGAR